MSAASLVEPRGARSSRKQQTRRPTRPANRVKNIMKLSIFVFASLAALAADMTDLDKRRLLAQSLLQREDYAAALIEAKAIQKERPDDIQAYQLTASAQMGLGDYDAAEKSIQWMLDLRIGKADANGWLLVARFREVTGDIEGALDAVNLAYARLESGEQKQGPELLAYAGHLHLLVGHVSLAEQAVGSSPSVTLARIRLKQGRREEAVQILQGMNDNGARFLMAELTGNYSGIEPNTIDYVLYLAGTKGNAKKALEHANQLAAKRRDVFTLDALAMAQFANGDTAAARGTMRRVVAIGSRDPRILAHLAQIGIESAQ